MRVTVAGIEFGSPVIAASGTFGYGVEFEDIVSLDRIGGFVTKGLVTGAHGRQPGSADYRDGRGHDECDRPAEYGRPSLYRREASQAAENQRSSSVIANVFGFTIDDCLEVIHALNDASGVAMYELNASCPNTSHGGMVFGTDPPQLWELVARCKAEAQRPLMVKLSPNVTDIGLMARVAADGGADAVSLVNTFVSLAIDVETRRPRIANVTGGLSGPAIKPIAVRMVHEVSKNVTIPIVGMGGIVRAEDAVEFMMAGATAVQVGTASYADPRAVENIADGLKRWCIAHDVAQVSSLTGSALL